MPQNPMMALTMAQSPSVQSSGRFAKVPRQRHVMQSFLAGANHSPENRTAARQRVLQWADKKWPGLVPPEAFAGQAFEYDQAGLRIAACSSSDGALWAFRSEHLDPRESRTWVTEAVVADVGPTDAFGVRNSCNTMGTEPVPASSPRFLRDFIAHHALTDAGVSVTAQAQDVTNGSALGHLIALLLSPHRVLPVVVLTPLSGGVTYAVDPVQLARDTQGLAHVFRLSPAMAFGLSDELGRALSVFHGAIRTYYPGFTRDADPWRHHLVFAQRIAEWADENGVGTQGFEQFLSRQLHHFSVNAPAKIEQLPSYFSIRRKLLDKPHQTTGEEMELLHLDLEQARASAQDWENQALDSDAEARAYEEETRQLRAQNLTLAHELKELRRARGEQLIPLPTSYADMPKWVDVHFADRLVLHKRAVRELKDAVFADVKLVGESLKLLAEAYWAMRTNHDPEQRQALSTAWDAEIAKLNLDYNSQAMSPNRMGEYRSDYTIDYRIGQSSQQILGPHLKYGSTKDDRMCMRVYFLWDDERQLVVIGSLPAHLDTRAS